MNCQSDSALPPKFLTELGTALQSSGLDGGFRVSGIQHVDFSRRVRLTQRTPLLTSTLPPNLNGKTEIIVNVWAKTESRLGLLRSLHYWRTFS
jgi:hypothetical protein